MSATVYLDVGPGVFGGYRVALMKGSRCDGQALFDTANDVAGLAKLLALPVLTNDAQIEAACKALKVDTALPPPARQEYFF